MITAERFHQQEELVKGEILANTPFVVVGAGAIGSFVIMTLAKMGAQNITVFDHDTIEDHNIANQMYPEYMVGQKKVGALKDVVDSYSGVKIKTVDTLWEKAQMFQEGAIVISAVDNMDVRKEIFECAFASNAKYFIDGRMGALILRAYSIDLKSQPEIDFYRSTLYSQAKASPERCTAKSIIFTVLLVSGIMLNMIKKRINGEKCSTEVILDSNTGFYGDNQ